MKILMLNGPNLNLLGRREPAVYGQTTLHELESGLADHAERLGIKLDSLQSNSESELIDAIHKAADFYDGIILNAGALTHYSYALRDAISATAMPVIEVHISNIYSREHFRHTSVISPVCIGQITGLGIHGYYLALDYFKRTIGD